jgi:hypothetical protein
MDEQTIDYPKDPLLFVGSCQTGIFQVATAALGQFVFLFRHSLWPSRFYLLR